MKMKPFTACRSSRNCCAIDERLPPLSAAGALTNTVRHLA
jgi:hypothetical protein